MTRTYLFVRHAEGTHQVPSLERDRRIGRDATLTTRGRHQARALAARLAASGVERVVSSSLRRARETAEIVALGGNLPYEHAWSELDEIAPRRLFRSPSPPRPEWWHGVLGAYHVYRASLGLRGGPADVRAVEDRVRATLARLDAMDEARIAVVGHGYWILLMALMLPGSVRLRPIPNCSITEVRSSRGAHRLVHFARAS